MIAIKKIALAGLGALTLVGAMTTPAAAQPYGREQRGYDGRGHDNRSYDNYRDRDGDRRGAEVRTLTSGYVDSLEWRINNAAREGRISWGQARQLRSELLQIQGPAIYRVENGRASEWEYRRVTNVVSRIEAATGGYANERRGPRYSSYRD